MTALTTLLSIAFLWCLVFVGYREYRIDLFRHRLFVLRAELFDLCRAEQIRFDDPAYTHLRTTINGFLRFGDRLGIVPAVTAAWVYRHNPTALIKQSLFQQRWSESIAKLPVDTRVQLASIRQRMHFEVAEQFLLSSPLFVLTLIPFALVAMARVAGKKFVWAVCSRAYQWVARYLLEHLLRPLDLAAWSVGDESDRQVTGMNLAA